MIRFAFISLTTVIMSIAIAGYIVYSGIENPTFPTVAIAHIR